MCWRRCRSASADPRLWEIKAIGLAVIFVYAFFKFAWSYRLFNYVAILLGAMPLAQPKRTRRRPQTHVQRTARLFDGGGPAFQPRPARVLLRTRLSRLVRQPLGVHGDHRGGRVGDVVAAVRLGCAPRDGRLMSRLKSRHQIPKIICKSDARSASNARIVTARALRSPRSRTRTKMRHRETRHRRGKRFGVAVRLCGARKFRDQPLQLAEMPRRGIVDRTGHVVELDRRGEDRAAAGQAGLIEPDDPALEEHAQARPRGHRWRATAR